MKGKLKLAVCVIAAVMAFSITAYADEGDPKEVLAAAVKKNAELKYQDTYSYLAVTMSDGKESESEGVTLDSKLKLAGPSQTQYLACQTNSSEGVPVSELTVFYHDGYIFSDKDDWLKIKSVMNMNDFLAAAEESATIEIPFIYDEDFDSQVEMSTVGDNRVITFHSMPKETNEFMNSILAENGGVNGEITINRDGYFTDIKLYGTFHMVESDDDALFISYIREDVFNNPGQPFNIEFPDESGYVELDVPDAENGPSGDYSWGYGSDQYGPAEEAELKAYYEQFGMNEDYNSDEDYSLDE